MIKKSIIIKSRIYKKELKSVKFHNEIIHPFLNLFILGKQIIKNVTNT